MAWFDPGFWSHHFRRVLVPQIRAFEQAFVTRVLPAFDNLEEEAESVANEEYGRLGRLPGDDSVEMADLAEDAQEAGLAHYTELTSVRQAMLNLATAALYHLVEQQLLLFHRRQVLHRSEEFDSALFSWSVIHERFADGGVKLRGMPSWASLHELECVANTVKHGDGRSAAALRRIRPEILVPEMFRGDRRFGKPTSYVLTPLTGESVHVTPEDFRRYASIAAAFWEDLADAIERAS